jgi:hypothetical protein
MSDHNDVESEADENLIHPPQVPADSPLSRAQSIIASFEGEQYDLVNSSLEIAANLLAYRIRTGTW